ncbi:fasciclin domain-containing protein [Sanyastnella coralliicola]|uniref:fasciclin domain-containing protein n=1 Tax=Sanyastnella coralliicola TaxID=3069118 RepID=UPI0027BA7C27|nr:fasciclin domain-containing protein [Longitalea sp. SCSIO 12813]
MRKMTFHFLTVCFAALTLAACNEPQNNDSAEEEMPTVQQPSNLTTNKEEATKPEEVIDRRPGDYDANAKAKMDQQKEEVTATEENITSPYRYLTTTEKFSHFGELLKASTLSKHVHGMGVTVLAPRNDVMENYPAWRDLLKEGNVEAIDAFVSAYIIDEIFGYKEMTSRENLINHTGEPLKITDRGGYEIAGASISTEEISTRNGKILVMNDLYEAP